MSLRVMTFVGFLVLAVGCMLFWLTPVTTSQPKSVKPIGTSALSHGGVLLQTGRNLVWTVRIPPVHVRKWMCRGGNG